MADAGPWRPLRRGLSDEAVALMAEQREAGQTPLPVHLMLVNDTGPRERSRSACRGGLGEWVTYPRHSRGRTVTAQRFADFKIKVDASGFIAAMERAVAAINRFMAVWGRVYDDHHPRPLCIDGHAYARRRRTRGRRR